MRKLLLSTAVVVLIPVSLAFLMYSSFQKRWYQQRCVEYDSVSLFKELGLADSDDISDLLTAKSPSVDGAFRYLIKFKIASESFEKYIESFDGEMTLFDFKERDDLRNRFDPVPEWFLQPIEKGEFGFLDWPKSHGGSIYIDTNSLEYYVIYIQGLM